MPKKVSSSPIYPVTSHTDHVGKGSTFVAIKGQKEDGINYIVQALERGATTIVIEQGALLPSEIEHAIKHRNAQLHRVQNTRAALAQLSAQAYEYQTQKLKIIGITGTKGKTTCSWLLFHILKCAGYKTALLSTVRNYIMDQPLQTELTTQHPDYLQHFFYQCLQEKIEFVVMEVAAQAQTLHRTDTLEFDGIIFTNFGQEHAEFYASLDDYFAAKASLLKQAKSGAPILINADSSWCQKLLTNTNYATFSIKNAGTYNIENIHTNANGLSFKLCTNTLQEQFICPALIGSFNAENCGATIAMALSLGITIPSIKKALNTFTAIPGRLARYSLPNGAYCFIDYAHNPSSFEAVLPLLKSLTDQLIVVFGCGGDRDRTKRPIMGSLAAQWADQVILTTDNPRSESAQAIIEEIYAGIPATAHHKVQCELDREKAIRSAYAHTQPHSIVALLGKGPDEYQHIGMLKFFFSEAQIVQSLSKERMA